jgi:hypothetical protein
MLAENKELDTDDCRECLFVGGGVRRMPHMTVVDDE